MCLITITWKHTYHILIEIYGTYNTMDAMIYFTFMILYDIGKVWYMYGICVHITFKSDSHINNICLGP